MDEKKGKGKGKENYEALSADGVPITYVHRLDDGRETHVILSLRRAMSNITI